MNTTAYSIPASTTSSEMVIKRSRFITILAHADSPAAARQRVEQLRSRYPTANHHCWAFVAGPPGDQGHIGCSDDGEPRGTAGRPMLQVLLTSGVGEVVAVVVRFFGGTKLGKGGLVKAYTQGVQAALEGLDKVEKKDWVELVTDCDYARLEQVKQTCRQFGARIREADFGERVTLHIDVEAHQQEDLAAALSR